MSEKEIVINVIKDDESQNSTFKDKQIKDQDNISDCSLINNKSKKSPDDKKDESNDNKDKPKETSNKKTPRKSQNYNLNLNSFKKSSTTKDKDPESLNQIINTKKPVWNNEKASL